MKHVPTFLLICSVLAFSLSSAAKAAQTDPSGPAAAATEPANEARAALWDVEVDPLAYVARGYSLHIGFRTSQLRFDAGSFGLTVPPFVHGQSGFEAQMDGYGVKLDVYLMDPTSGPFVGVEGAWLHQEIVDTDTQTRAQSSGFSAGGRFGWEFPLGAGFYAKPWVGVGYNFDSQPILVEGKAFHQNSLMLFPTVHLGYVFP